MKKISMGMMLSSLLLIQIGCGEEAPVNVPPATDPGAMIHSAAGEAAKGHDAAKDAVKEGTEAVEAGKEAIKEGTEAVKEGEEAVKEGAEAVKEGVDAAKEVAP